MSFLSFQGSVCVSCVCQLSSFKVSSQRQQHDLSIAFLSSPETYEMYRFLASFPRWKVTPIKVEIPFLIPKPSGNSHPQSAKNRKIRKKPWKDLRRLRQVRHVKLVATISWTAILEEGRRIFCQGAHLQSMPLLDPTKLVNIWATTKILITFHWILVV